MAGNAESCTCGNEIGTQSRATSTLSVTLAPSRRPRARRGAAHRLAALCLL
jgi:hypothetical protein